MAALFALIGNPEWLLALAGVMTAFAAVISAMRVGKKHAEKKAPTPEELPPPVAPIGLTSTEVDQLAAKIDQVHADLARRQGATFNMLKALTTLLKAKL